MDKMILLSIPLFDNMQLDNKIRQGPVPAWVKVSIWTMVKIHSGRNHIYRYYLNMKIRTL